MIHPSSQFTTAASHLLQTAVPYLFGPLPDPSERTVNLSQAGLTFLFFMLFFVVLCVGVLTQKIGEEAQAREMTDMTVQSNPVLKCFGSEFFSMVRNHGSEPRF